MAPECVESTRVLRGARHSTQGVWQLESQVQSRASTAGAQAALSARRPKSCLSHTLSHSLSHMTNDPLSRPIVPPAREGHRRAFSDEDKRRIVEEAAQPGASLSAVARRYGIAARVLFRWKQELAAPPVFIAVQIADAHVPPDAARSDEEHAP